MVNSIETITENNSNEVALYHFGIPLSEVF